MAHPRIADYTSSSRIPTGESTPHLPRISSAKRDKQPHAAPSNGGVQHFTKPDPCLNNPTPLPHPRQHQGQPKDPDCSSLVPLPRPRQIPLPPRTSAQFPLLTSKLDLGLNNLTPPPHLR
ncbi:hypothetical protein BHE74_00026172 [Ensete ventricosum]|nr:hypothetical protein BHE74_00026172 [Ensete ventricosum]RZR85192.1 hypothetical protein BHM03_00012145 [Ensete ventricosum]